jgi:hypothetical protein
VTDTPLQPGAGSLGLTGHAPLRFTGPLEAITALYRYFIWADRMRSHFLDLLAAADAREKAGQPVSVEERLFTYPYMSYWYAGAYVVVDGWARRLHLNDPTIDELLLSPNVAKLKRHRHGTFHFHPKYFDAKLLEFTTSGDWAAWIEQLHEEFRRWFLDYFRQLDSEEGESNA